MSLGVRIFTIHFQGVVHEVPIDCRLIRTLRELIIAKLQPLCISSTPQSSSSTSLLSVQREAAWVDSCVCSFVDQRLSLATLTEVAPTTLHVTWGLHNRGDRKITESRRTGLSKRKRFSDIMNKEKEDDNDDDDNSVDNNNNASSNSNNSEYDVAQTRRRYRCRYETLTGRKLKGCNNVEEEEEEEEKGYEVQRRNDVCISGSKSIEMRRDGESDADNIEDNEDDADDDDSDDVDDVDDSDDLEGKSDHQQQAVLPLIVGGVVRLINMESRDKSHQWTVYIRGLFNETNYLSQCIESVCFILDPSFTPSERLVTSAPFELTEEGWGEFVVKMKVQLRHYPRPIQVILSSSSFSEMMVGKSELKMASVQLVTQTAGSVPGLTRGPVFSPVIDVLNHHKYYSDNKNNSNSNFMSTTTPTSTFAHNGGVVKTEVDVKENQDDWRDMGNNDDNKTNVKGDDTQLTGRKPLTATLQMCPGTVVLSHLLRFSHRPRRGHCIPPLGRPYEPEEHIGYTLVQTPVITEQYDEIVVPDPPAAIYEVVKTLPDMLRQRIATVKAARAMAQQQIQQLQEILGPSGLSSLRVSAAFSEEGVSCWKYIIQEEPDDAVFAESYLESISAARFLQQQQQQSLYGIDPLIFVKPGRGRRKLAGAEIDLAALKTAKKGLEEAIDKMRREVTLRQAAHMYRQYI